MSMGVAGEEGSIAGPAELPLLALTVPQGQNHWTHGGEGKRGSRSLETVWYKGHLHHHLEACFWNLFLVCC